MDTWAKEATSGVILPDTVTPVTNGFNFFNGTTNVQMLYNEITISGVRYLEVSHDDGTTQTVVAQIPLDQIVLDDQVLVSDPTGNVTLTFTASAPTGLDNQVNYTVKADVNLCDLIANTPDNGNFIIDGDKLIVEGCEKKTFDTCELLKAIPVGVYDPTANFIQLKAGSGVPSTSLGYDIDNNELGCSGGLPSTSEIGDFQILAGGQVIPPSPIPMTDVTAVNAFINSDVIPALGLVTGDIIYTYDATLDIATMWYSPAVDQINNPLHNIVIGPLGANTLCVKVIPQIPTVTVPTGGCPELVTLPEDIVTEVNNTVTGNKIADYTNEAGTAVDINESITNFGTPVVTYPTANTINIALPYNQEGNTTQTVNIPVTLPTPVSVVNSIDFKPTVNPNEFTVEIVYTNDLGVQTTITDTTPVTITNDGNERKLARTNSTAAVEPTAIEIPSPVNGDTATIKLLNNNVEHWNYTGTTWTLAFTQNANTDFVQYTGNNTIPTGTPVNGVDTIVLSNGSRYQWDGTQWILQGWAWGTTTSPTELTTVNTGRTGNTGFGFNNPLHTADVGGSLGLNLTKVNTPTTTIASGAGSPTIVYLDSASLQTVTLANTAQTRRVLYFVNNTSVAKVISPYLSLDGTTRTDIPPFSGLMLQNALTEWREVMSTKLPPTFDATVSFSTATPTTAGVVFTPNTPASTTVLYVSSIDGSQWTYNGTTYVTAPISSDWKITGNAGTVQATNFVGTTDNVGLSLRTANVIRQTITNTGNVGIGTTTPTTLLNVQNTSGTSANVALFKSLNGAGGYAVRGESVNAVLALGVYGELGVWDGSRWSGVRGNSGVSNMPGVTGINTLSGGVSAYFNERVGIGTTAPATLFHVNGTSTFAGGATISGTGTSTWIAMPSGGSGIGTTNAVWAANVVGASNFFTGSLPGDTAHRNLTGKLLFGNTTGAPAMAITGNNVGIGTLAPTQKLHVIGNILASGTITPSDKRLKSKIKDVSYGVKDLLKLKPVSYTKKFSLDKEEKGEVKEFGFIAQDLQKVFPELVTENGADKLLAVNYTSLIPVLVKAIQEQQKEIELLKSKIK